MTTTIQAYLKERCRECACAELKVNQAREQLQQRIAERKANQKSLGDDLAKKRRLKTEMEREGLPVAEISKQLDSLTSQVDSAGKDAESLRAELARLGERNGVPLPLAFPSNDVDVLGDVLAECGWGSVSELQTMEEWARVLRVGSHLNQGNDKGDIDADDIGRPVLCRVRVAGGGSVEVPIKAGHSRYLRAFRPKALFWLPTDCDESTGGESRTRSTVERTAFLVPGEVKPVLSCFEDARLTVRNRELESKANSISILVDKYCLRLDNLLKALLAAAGGELDLSGAYPQSPALAAIQSQLLGVTQDAPAFPMTEERLVSGEILTRIRPDWDRIAAAPWSGAITEAYALLKYHLEGGDRPRFWCREYRNMYGFRLRTRDHTWLCGQLFIDERADSSKPGSELLIRQRKVGNRYSPKTIETATVSRLHVIAWESEE